MATVYETIQDLGKIITDAVTAGNSNNIPARAIRKTLIKVTTGQYREVLPIIVPAECCIMGDELRAVNVQPRKSTNSTLTPKSDYKYSSKALERIEKVVGNVAAGLTMTPTTGNTLTQTTAYPYAETPQAWEGVTRQVRGIRRSIDAQLGDKLYAELPKPWDMTNTNAGRGRDLYLLNREFIKAETTAYIGANYPNLKYGRTKCKQDIGFLLDAVAYDLTYGGNWQSVIAGEAYYTGTQLNIPADSKAATLAAYGFLKQLVQTVQRNITVTPLLQTDVAQIAGTGGTASESTTIGNLFDDIIDIIDNGVGSVAIVYPSVANTNALTFADSNDIDSNKAAVAIDTIDFINYNFGSYKYDSSLCRRDLEILSEGAKNDVLTGSNYLALQAGRAYQRATSSYLLGSQKTQTVGAIRKYRDEIIDDLTDATYITRARNFYNEVIDIIQNGLTAANTATFPVYNSAQDKQDAMTNLTANKTFIEDDVIQYVENTYNNPPGSFIYDSDNLRKYVGDAVEGMAFDIMYGGNIAQVRTARSFFDEPGTARESFIITGKATQYAGALTHMSSICQQIVQEQSVTKQTGNTQTQSTAGSPASATEATQVNTFLTESVNAINAGVSTGISAITEVTSTETGQTATDYALFDSNRDSIVATVLQHVTDTYNDFKYNHAKCTRDLGLIFDAARYDAMLDTNYASIITAYSYRRAGSNKVLGDQKDATIAANTFAMKQMKAILIDGDIRQEAMTRQLDETLEWVNDIIWTASHEGANKQVADPEIYNSNYQLETNKEWLVQEAINESDQCYRAAVSKVEANGTVHVADTSWLTPNMEVKFFNYDDSTSAVAEIGTTTDTAFYVKEIVNDTSFTVSTSVNGSAFTFDPTQSAYQYNKGKCRRDTGYILEGVGYDVALGTNYNAVTSGNLYRQSYASESFGAQLVQTTAGINFSKARVAELYKVRTSTTGLSRANAAFTEIVDILNNGLGNANALTFPAPSTTSTNRQNAVAQLIANRAFLGAEITAWAAVNHGSITWTTEHQNEILYAVDALCYDIMYGGTSASHNQARNYVINGNKRYEGAEQGATIGAFQRLATVASQVIQETTVTKSSGNSATQDTSGTAATATEGTLAETNLQIIEDVVTSGNLPTDAATYPDVNFANADLRAAQIQINNETKAIAIDTVRYLDNTYSALVQIRSTYDYSKTLCARDVREYVYAMKWDAQYSRNWKTTYRAPLIGISDRSDTEMDYTGWYRSALAARLYANSVLGSQEEDMYYLRNGTGIRLQSLDGLQGDLGSENAFGTRRPTAGAYASLDPGWGPKDERVWITARSPYVQNVSTFGYAAVGQKIDGALHDGGNDSIVSNDFTQVISDGIGAWLLNNGRAELVSVFTYYAHIGYLCETGGRARATNGNNSYGTFGSVAEGVDPDEIPVTAIVDNSTQYNATISNVFTNTDELLRLEYSHAGNDYTEAKVDIFGAGTGEELVADEFRDGAIHRIEIGETVESPSNAGGTNYTVVSNTAQAGTTTSINLAATDGSLSSAYVGMAIYITGGAAVGNYGYITSYNSGSKLANVSDRYGNPGWSHVVPGTTIVAPNSSSTYQVEPRIEIPAPANSADAATNIGTDTINDVEFVETAAQYTGVASESNGDGSGATFNVTRNGAKYYVTVATGGTEYTRLDTATILGSSLGGVSPDNDITVTITTVNATTGAIVDFDFAGIGQKGYFVALADGNFYLSTDGKTNNWTNRVRTGNHLKLASALQNDGSTTFKPHAVVVTAPSTTTLQVSTDETLTTWTSIDAQGITTAGTEMSVAHGYVGLGTNKFVVISNGDQAISYSTDGGSSWTGVNAALPATGFNAITYGKGLFVAIKTGSNEAATSVDGETWTARTLPQSADWEDVVWGNGIFVAMAQQPGANNLAYSIDGINWTSASAPDATKQPSGLAYGQGVFVVTYDNDETQFAESYDGVTWFARTGLTDIGEKVAFGNPCTAGASTPIGRFVSVEDTSNTAKVIYRGAPALGRAGVANEKVFEVRMLEPGSGYEGTPPTITITDPGNIEDVVLNAKIGNGALANPTFVNRGGSFITASAEIDATNSNGGADFLQSGQFVAVRRLSATPVNGSNVVFDSLPNQFFKLVNTVSLVGTNDGSKTAFLQLSPDMSITDAPVDGDPVTMRIRFSQVRLTGHDFLDIGTGGFTSTNYPGVPTIAPDQTKETKDSDGGRVFFTATDQDGNFRVGDLFSIEQATGVATLNAEAFNIAGLQELTLGEVTLGGNSASVTEFSTDPFFTANSDSVVPTQRAVKAYIEAQIGGGGATLNVNSVTAGDIFINTNQITTVSGELINIKANVNFSKSVLGLPMAFNYFLR